MKACHTQEEIAEAVGLPRKTVDDQIRVLANLDTCPVSPKLLATYQDAEFKRRKEIYETLHPETAHGGDRGANQYKVWDRQNAESATCQTPSFVEDTATKARPGQR